MKKILFLNYEFPPLGGGAANANYYLFKELAKYKDIQITLITSSTGKYKEEDFSDNIKIYYLDIGKNNESAHFQTNKDLLKYSMKSYFFAKKILKNENYHKIFAFFGIPCGYIAEKLSKKFDIPYIVSLRGSDVPFYNPRFEKLDKYIFQKLSKKIWKNAEKTITLSKDLTNLAKKTSSQQEFTILYNGVDCNFYKPDNNTKNLENTTNILFVGRLIQRKGLDYLLEAFKNLSSKYDKLKLYIAGDGPKKEEYNEYIKINNLSENVVFLGNLPKDTLLQIYQKSHIFVLPSLNEALGNVTQEALACGIPIITTKTGAAEFIKDGENGYVIDKKKSKQIEEKLDILIKDKNLTNKMGENSRKVAIQYDRDNVAEKIYNLL
ncbi:glycosyltransferase family 4 protein [Candidatus Absconditicoccus praedator]|uniref:glycosyltransferase family 4 protein n=1 Tax=Candidatus Absconditicoccus praedator TaxID=2735562 RepID=UPI001E3F608D|nr:glycosyltransferase family 4 protein [Candidatus Absconditicoccus praedator]UFX83179.1 glycosyltransferase family 4 protein [Candidatus Absconditicoccus praedator]